MWRGPAPSAGSFSEVGGAYEWGREPIRAGQWTCPKHGPIRPDRGGVVPSCPELAVDGSGRVCQWAAAQAKPDGRGGVVHHTPDPRHCAGPDRHPLRDAMSSTWSGCLCTPVGGHTIWVCRRCGDRQMWPPHVQAPG